MKKLLGLFTLVLVAVTLVACGTPNEAPTFSGVGNAQSFLYVEFDALEGVTATDKEDGDLTADIVVVSNNVNVEAVGNYQVKYEVEDSKGKKTEVTRSVAIVEPSNEDVELAQYLSGVDLSKLPAEDKDVLFAALEDYLLENVYGGVPLYSGASRVMYSDRVSLYSTTYNGVMGFGTAFSQFTEDDSTVYMNASQMGNAGEYTWRSSYSTDPTTLNPWIADDQPTSDFIDLFTGSLYSFFFDESKTGYEILPSLAGAEPQPVNPTTINGKQYAKVWQIPIKDGLEWNYHPDFNVSSLPAGHEVLNAEDFLWTWQYALQEGWFRARTGGGDFVTNGIKGAADFVAGNATIDEVGLRLAEGEDNTLELEFISEKSAFDIKYMFSGSNTAINKEFYTTVGEDYGSSPVNVPSSGIYYFDTHNLGQYLLFKKNDLHPDADLYHFTGQQYRFIEGSEQIFQEFLEGRLESASVPSARITEFASDPRVQVAPDPTTWRLHINAFGTEANRDAYIEANPGNALSETFVPEPILMYKEMRQALYYGFDRETAAVDVVKTYLPAFTLFTSTYFLDAESGTSVRGLPAGAALLEKYAGETYGFVPDAAIDLFHQAVTKAIADGYYQAGTAEAYTVIELSFTYGSSGSTSAQAMVAEMVQQYETRLVDTTNFVKIDIQVNDVAFPNQYYNYMMKANTDLGLGGISGSLLNAPSFLDVFSDDNRGGFTLNWGIDTTTPEIVVGYNNMDGEFVYEKWGYNALMMALNGKTYVRDGVEQTAWTDPEDLIAAYLDMAGEALDSVTVDEEIAPFIVGDLEELSVELDVDSVGAWVAVTESGKNYLYILTLEGANYELHGQYGLSTTAEAAIQGYINTNYGDYALTAFAGPLTEAEIIADAYISESYGYQTLAEAAADLGAPAEFLEIYSTTWDDDWTDAVAVLHIGDYYIGWSWL